MRGSTWLCGLIALLFAASIGAAQAVKDSGTGLAGEVVTLGCSSVLNARVLLVDLKSLQTQTTESGEFGAFSFRDLKPGDYAVIVTGPSACFEPHVLEVRVTQGKIERFLVFLPLDVACLRIY
jgi:hypothetical protein